MEAYNVFKDLAIIILAANAAGILGSTALGYPGVILGGIVTGMVLMTLNFLIFVYTKIPSWIAGIGMAMVYEAIAFFYSSRQLAKGSTIAQLESEMRKLGYARVLTSTLSTETAQYFYQKRGYKNIGGFNLSDEPYEIIFQKEFDTSRN